MESVSNATVEFVLKVTVNKFFAGVEKVARGVQIIEVGGKNSEGFRCMASRSNSLFICPSYYVCAVFNDPTIYVRLGVSS